MGNEMGNNNTTPDLKEEDIESKADENKIAPVAKGQEVDTKVDGLASNDTTDLGNETSKGDYNGDGVKGENLTIVTSKAKDVTQEGAETSNDEKIELDKGTTKEDSHADAEEAENIEEKVARHAFVESTGMLQYDLLHTDTDEDEVIAENEMHPTNEAEGVQNNATSLASDSITNDAHGNGSLEGNTCEDDVNVDHEKHLSSKEKVVPEESVPNDVNDKTSEAIKDESQNYMHVNDRQGESATNTISKDIVDGQSNMEDPFLPSVKEKTEIRHPEVSPNAGLVETDGENSKILSSSLLEGTEESEKQEDLCLKKNLQVSYDHHIDDEPSIKQEDKNDAELQKSPDVHSNHNELNKFLNEPSLQGSESIQRSDNLDNNPLCSSDKDDALDKELEIKQKMACATDTEGEDGDGDEYERSVNYASETSGDSRSKISDRGLLDEANHSAVHSMNSLPEPGMVNMVVVYEERKLSRIGSKVENLLELDQKKIGQFWEEPLKELKADTTNTNCMIMKSNEGCNGEERIVHDDQVEEPKITENGHQFNVFINKLNTSDRINTSSVPEDFVGPEEEENNKEKIVVYIEQVREGSYEDMSEQFNSRLLDAKENDRKSLGAIANNHDSSNLTVPSLDLVDEEVTSLIKEAEIMISEGYEARESITRSSTESNTTDHPNISGLVQKSPSFNLNLRIEATPEESDRINSMARTEFEPCILQHEEMPVEEKVVTMERSYSERFKAPFLGLLKEEEEEAHILVMPKKQEKELTSDSPTGKEKRKLRPFFFSSCMCCTTVTN